MAVSLEVAGLQAAHGQALGLLFCVSLAFSSFSLRLGTSSENMAVSGGRKEATHLGYLLYSPLLSPPSH